MEKKGKKNVYNGRILEIQGLPNLTVEQAFELSDASAERSLGLHHRSVEESVAEYLRSNVVMLRWMIANGYGDVRTLERRAAAMEEWLANPTLLRADENAEYAKSSKSTCPRSPSPCWRARTSDDVKPSRGGRDGNRGGSSAPATNIGHFRAAGLLQASGESIPSRLWIAPPTRMDEQQLMEEGFYNIYAQAGRARKPGCPAHGNQARIRAGSTCVSTSTRTSRWLGQGPCSSPPLSWRRWQRSSVASNNEVPGFASKINSMARRSTTT